MSHRQPVTSLGLILLVFYAGITHAQFVIEGQPVQKVDGQTLAASFGIGLVVDVAKPFTYAGGQRFILRGHTDVEQHFFVVADENGDIGRMYWIQSEQKLPQAEGQYRYPEASSVDIDGHNFGTHVRYYDTEPVSDSDRGAAYSHLAVHGYRVPTLALRARLIHIPAGDSRRELMIVYLEAASSSGEIDDEKRAAMIRQASQGMTIRVSD